ncbi:efflux RND transporter periplasmic adaptor subunit [Burkholderia plantarii]|uniref:efflux RND transporter periplasmic adaptor subunit n=1 Tax=Burkholderia plantarii TaxID=41899 RepID=UPI00272ADB77|nr:efflux RND transporter periplasmic adaptor subunit [Burkholderia plantarii]WLE62602.1 efflux RND transporter periplasmic adaptor subunit [Burkholderia plantarii]
MTQFMKYRATAAVALLVAARAASAATAAPAAPPARPAPVPAAAPAAPAAPAAAPASPDGNDSRIRIQLVSRDQVDVSSEISAKIASLPFRDGDTFRAGQTLVTLDCSLFNAQLRKAQADAEGARELLDTNRKLQALHSIGELEVQQAQAKQKASAADVAYMQATVRKCAIAAPFDGRVSKRSASPQQFAEPGKPLLTIIDTSHLELKMIVPSKWLAWLKPGHPLSVQVDEVGKTYPARVARIGARVDPVTQTVDVTAALNGGAPELLPGMSGWATFAR